MLLLDGGGDGWVIGWLGGGGPGGAGVCAYFFLLSLSEQFLLFPCSRVTVC